MSFQTADLYDAHEGKVKVAEPMFRTYGGKGKFYGEIVTIKCHEDNSLVGQTLKEKNGKGKVLVVDGGGSLRCALVGDQLAEKAMANEWEGIIVYGCVRDSGMINDMEIGIRALNTNPVKSVKRGTGVFNEPVTFAGITFRPGSYVYADEDGILVSDNLLV
jgi:regulator of ribonuclease activity A